MLRNKKNNGVTLVEVMFTLVIASVFFVALLNIYIYGIKQFDNISMKYKMYEETAWALEQMEKIIWAADSVSISSSLLRVRIPDIQGNGYRCGWIDFSFNSSDHTLRMDDRRNGYNNYNLQILPAGSKQAIRRFGARKQPYKVADFQYEFIDDKEFSIKISLFVEESEENDDSNKISLKLSTTAFMENSI